MIAERTRGRALDGEGEGEGEGAAAAAPPSAVDTAGTMDDIKWRREGAERETVTMQSTNEGEGIDGDEIRPREKGWQRRPLFPGASAVAVTGLRSLKSAHG